MTREEYRRLENVQNAVLRAYDALWEVEETAETSLSPMDHIDFFGLKIGLSQLTQRLFEQLELEKTG